VKGVAAQFPEPKGSRRRYASGRIASRPADQQAVRAFGLSEAGLDGRDLPVHRESDGNAIRRGDGHLPGQPFAMDTAPAHRAGKDRAGLP
jgi:hypothetical protein